MKVSALTAFQLTIAIGLGVQVMLVLGGVIYSLHVAGSKESSQLSPLLHSNALWSDHQLERDEVRAHAHHPLSAMIQSFADPRVHNPESRRNCFAFTSVPGEIEALVKHVKSLMQYSRYARFIDCIHLSIPHRSLRFGGQDYPTTEHLLKLVDDPRIIIHRLFDYGPMTRYIGPLAYERHEDTSIVIFDMDSKDMIGSNNKDLAALFHAARQVDTDAMWCLQGENFWVENDQVRPKWDTFPSHRSRGVEWNLVHFCRGVGGLLFKPKQFTEFWYNQSEYHESCFWDDDRWVGYQMERIGVPLKVVHPNATHFVDLSGVLEEKRSSYAGPVRRQRKLMTESTGSNFTTLDPYNGASTAHRRLGSLTEITNRLRSDQTCPKAWLRHHPDAFPTARPVK